jgi:hypothetical protein
MRKYLIIAVAVFASVTVFAKKVKFAVDMTGVPVNVTGMHITGDFQDEAGYPGGDWQPNTTALLQEITDTNIYSLVVDIPAFRAYEFKFINGIYSYEVEFVPIESRVLYNFDDNRWLYVDSLANDTTFAGAIRFSANAPAGKYLLRFGVDMQNESSISTTGVHAEGAFQNWDPQQTRMHSFDGTIYEHIIYIDTLDASVLQEYLFVNGNTPMLAETVPSLCATPNNFRGVFVPKDSMLTVVCFSACVDCQSVGIRENGIANQARVSPNPSSGYMIVEFNDEVSIHHVYVRDMTGRTVRTYSNCNSAYLRIEKEELPSGMYFLDIQNAQNERSTLKLIFN